ncbi:MAG: TrkA family potassium uptake protein [Planctomycetaceae bacterium]|nr:TrkA family potassium uptake protein [Planctomycetota bacterium]NUN52395.1 TrkA family potassium uptake protein [Planctomycetaceae bacterium]
MTRIAVLGLGIYGFQITRTLARLGAHVVAVDRDPALIEQVKRLAAESFVADVRDREALRGMGIASSDAVVICLGDDFEASEVCVIHLKELGAKRIIVRATTEERADILEALGPDQVITPTLDEARKMGQILMTPSVEDYARLKGGRSVVLYRAPEAFVGRTLGELKLGTRFRAFTVAVRHQVPAATSSPDAGMNHRPSADLVIREGDLLYIMGFDEDLLRLASRYA